MFMEGKTIFFDALLLRMEGVKVSLSVKALTKLIIVFINARTVIKCDTNIQTFRPTRRQFLPI